MIGTRESQSDKRTISVTDAAHAAIDRLKEANGDILFHLPGGCCDARTPVCLPVGDLQLGPRDRLIGHADGVPVYEMAADDDGASGKPYRLDVVAGLSVGFSLSPGDGTCFALREIRGEPR